VSFTFCDNPAIARETRGLVPYRRRRRPGDGMDAERVEAWAATQEWYPRVRARRSDVRFYTWFVEPVSDAERASLSVVP
jgi:hypothetical protein